LFIIILVGIKLITDNIEGNDESNPDEENAYSETNKTCVNNTDIEITDEILEPREGPTPIPVAKATVPNQTTITPPSFKFLTNQFFNRFTNSLITASKNFHSEGDRTVYETTLINVNTPNAGITNDLSKWKNIDEMKTVANDLNYKVNDWSTHLNLIVNEIGCPFYGYDTRIGTWNKLRFLVPSIRMVNNRTCTRFIFITFCRDNWFPSITQDWHENWVENQSHIISYKMDIDNYNYLLSQIVSKGQINNDASLRKMVNFNNTSETFSTIEGYAGFSGFSNPFRFVSIQDIIKKNNGTGVVNQNSINMLNKRDYKVRSEEHPRLAKRYAYQGKTLADLGRHISTMEKFGIKNEDSSNYLKKLINKTLNPNGYPVLDVELLITNYFSGYGIMTASDLFYMTSDGSPNCDANGGFVNAVKRFDLQNQSISLFPTEKSIPNCVMEKLKAINGVNIPIVGKDSNGNYHIHTFFQAFQTYNITSRQFLDTIYPNYDAMSIKSSSKNIDDTLYYINSIDPSNLINAFQVLVNLLPKIGLSFNEYMEYVKILETRVGQQSKIDEIWNMFKTYYTSIAYIDEINYKYDPQLKPNSFAKFLDDINTYYADNASDENKQMSRTYFYPGAGDFHNYMKILNEKMYKVSDIKRDIDLGQNFSHFIAPYNDIPSNEGFSSMDIYSVDPISYIYNQLIQFFTPLFNFYGKKEGMNSDYSILYEFKVPDYNNSLNELEDTLIGYDVNDINRQKTTWQNIITFVNVLVKIGIYYPDMKSFIGTLNLFGATNIKQWMYVMDILSTIKVQGGSVIQSFLNIVQPFGVKYDAYDKTKSNFEPFIDNLVSFRSDFSSGSLMSLNQFVKDMTKLNYTYETRDGTTAVNNIIAFFSNYEFTMNDYYSNDSIKINSCDLTIPNSFPSLFVNSLNTYSNSSTYGNKLYDIQTNTYYDLCFSVGIMQQAYMLTNGSQTYNDMPAIIIPNVTVIVSFFYKEEMINIINNQNAYSDMNKRIKLMNDIASGMIRYSETFRTGNQDTYILYINIALFLQMFPALAFQYLSNEFISKCSNGNCSYSIYMDPSYSECKASTTNKTINLRPSSPIL